MIRKTVKKRSKAIKKPAFTEVQDEYLDIDLRYLMQSADLALDEHGTQNVISTEFVVEYLTVENEAFINRLN